MFTGIVQAVGQVTALTGGSITVRTPRGFSERIAPGGSVAVNGVCLTARERGSDWFTAEVSGETATRTTLGGIVPGTRVNLELPLRSQDGIDGHIVLGHVDAVGRVKKIVRDAGGWRFTFSYPPEFARYLVEKGSIAVDGISLTAFAVTAASFTCAVIATTFTETTIGDCHPGDAVNLEFDILGKYVERMLDVYRS